MGKKLSVFFSILIAIIFIFVVNIFLKINSDFTHLISLNLIILLNFIILLSCLISINIIFKNSNLDQEKNFKENIRSAVANSFFISSIISIIGAFIIYYLLKNILEFLNIKEGIINYTIFAAKTWFVSSPFIGLEITIFKYFSKLEIYKKPAIILAIKFIIYCSISLFLYLKLKNNCIVYAKPICDIIFLPYYTKICFDLTLKSV
jgi:hypothetical protein